MDPSFTRALQKITPHLRERPGARFTVIINGQKKPEGRDWGGPNGANYAINDAPLAGYLSAGHNYGVLCGHAGINVVDIDDPNALEELGIMQRIPSTMQVKTGRGGKHVYIDCAELDHQMGLYHPTLKDADGEPLHLGEIQSLGQQVVGPGSIHPNGNRYELINDAPILKISKADLLKIFDGLILTGINDPAEEPHRAEHRRRSSGGSSLGDLIPIDAVAWPKNIKERCGSEVIGSHPLHGSTGGKNFAVNTAKNCWHCFHGGHNSGGGPLEWIAVEVGLISCQDAKKGCLNKDTLNKVLQIARDRGFDIPEPERQKAGKEKPVDLLEKFPKLEDLTKATGRMDRINPFTGMKEADPDTGETEIPRLTLSPSKACRVITEYMALRIASDDDRENPKLWRCNGKIWKPDGDRQVVNLIDAVLGDLSYDRGLKETLRRIRGVSDMVTFDSSPYLFPALDKVIDMQTGASREYMPEDYLTFQYGAAFDNPNSGYRPPLWLLCSSLPDPRDVLTALDIATAVFLRLALEAIIQLIGPGGNGKGVFEKMLIELCTLDRVAAITLLEAKTSRFGPGAVIGKDLWILSEVEDVKSTINLLKKVSTGEFTDSDTKYGERMKGKPHVLPILDCNNAIDFGDDSWGRKRRVIKLDYPFTFDYVPGTRLKDPHLEELVKSPEALSGLLQIIAARAPFLCRSRKIYTRKRPEEMDAEYKRQQYSLHYFCEECLTTEKRP
jgi:hypothetical protein